MRPTLSPPRPATAAPTRSSGRRSPRRSSPPPTHLGQALKVLIKISTKALGKLRPRQLRGLLHRRLSKPAGRPPPDISDIRIPGSDQSTPGCIAPNRPRLRAIAQEALEDALVHLGRRNTVCGTKPHKRRQPPANKSIPDLGPQLLPCGRHRRPVLGNALFPRQPAQGALHVALVVSQRLERQPSGHMVQPGEIGSNGTQSRGNQLQRLVQR